MANGSQDSESPNLKKSLLGKRDSQGNPAGGADEDKDDNEDEESGEASSSDSNEPAKKV